LNIELVCNFVRSREQTKVRVLTLWKKSILLSLDDPFFAPFGFPGGENRD
jgi:hypothetical protein